MTDKQNISRWWTVALFVIFLLPGLAVSTWVTQTPLIKEALGASTSEMGLVLFGIAVGSMIGLSISPIIIARKGARFVILICGLLIASGLASIALAVQLSSIILAMLCLVIFGFGFGLAEIAINVEGAALEQAHKKSLLTALHAMFSAGTLIGAFVGSMANANDVAIWFHFSGMSIMIALLLLIFYRYLPLETGREQSQISESKTTLRDRLQVWRERRLIWIGVIIFGFALAEGSANDWLPLMMVDGYGVNSTFGAYSYSLFVTATLIARLLSGIFLNRFGRVKVLIVTGIIGIIGMVLILSEISYSVAMIGVLLWGIGAAVGFPVCISAAGDAKKGAAARVGAVAMIGYLAFLVGPPFLGMIGEHFGLLKALYVIMFFVVLAMIPSKNLLPVKDEDSVDNIKSH